MPNERPEKPLSEAILGLNRLITARNILAVLGVKVLCLALSLVLVGLAGSLFGSSWFTQATIGLITFISCLIFLWPKFVGRIDEPSLRLRLEMKFKATDFSFLDPAKTPQVAPFLDQETRDIKQQLWRGLGKRQIPLLLAGALCLPFYQSIHQFGRDSLNAMIHFLRDHRNSVTVLSGALNPDEQELAQSLGGELLELDLIESNLLQLDLYLPGEQHEPVADLKDPETSEIIQSFLIPSDLSQNGDQVFKRYQLTFSLAKPAKLYIESVFGNRPVADFRVKTLPIPIVELTPKEKLSQPWHDDKPISLKIKVNAQAPLRQITLLLKVGDRQSKELVQAFQNVSDLSYQTTYEVLLEPYVSNDISEVEIVVMATDSSVPRPLSGYSQPLILTTASAYGRYRQALNALNDLKRHMDGTLSELGKAARDEGRDEEFAKLIEEAARKSGDTPFFDELDRIRLHQLLNAMGRWLAGQDMNQFIDIGTKLAEFLLEHEILDDRERDRDFFVAARGLSRVLDQPPEKRRLGADVAVDNLLHFLKQRQERWALRVKRIPAGGELKHWARVKSGRAFEEPIGQIPELDLKAPDQAQARLGEAVTSYRQWIDELEALEDSSRQKAEQERQQGLASARQKLRELQKAQDRISSEVDRASEQVENLKNRWSVIRVKQNSNLKDSRSLEAQLRALSPQATGRMKAAVEAMAKVLEHGEAASFAAVESFADLAGRLLRQAEEKSKSSGSRRAQRRRRISGDRYYGQSVHGDLDIQRDYKVDRRYREAILEQFKSQPIDSPQERHLLEDYLRKIIR